MSRILKALLLLFLVQAVIVHCEEDHLEVDEGGEMGAEYQDMNEDDKGGKMEAEDHEDEDNEGGEMGAEDHEDEDNEGDEMGAEDHEDEDDDGGEMGPEDDDTNHEEDEDGEYQDPKKIMEAIDANKDGKISLEEMTAKIKEESDGDEPEMVNKSIATMEKVFKQSDWDGDGFIQEAEMPYMLKALNEEYAMEAIDASKDGKISKEEMTAKIKEESDGDEPEMVKKWIAAMEKVFLQSDKNGDGFIQEEEMPDMLKALNEEGEL